MKTLMKLRMIFAMVGALLLLAPVVALADDKKIGETEVKDLLKSVDEACRKKDVAGQIVMLSSNAQIVVVLKDKEGKTNRIEWKRAEYEKYLKQSAAALEDYQYERKDVKITIAEDGLSAKAVSSVFEKTTMNGKKISSENRETATFTKKEGKLLVEKLEDEVISMKAE